MITLIKWNNWQKMIVVVEVAVMKNNYNLKLKSNTKVMMS